MLRRGGGEMGSLGIGGAEIGLGDRRRTAATGLADSWAAIAFRRKAGIAAALVPGLKRVAQDECRAFGPGAGQRRGNGLEEEAKRQQNGQKAARLGIPCHQAHRSHASFLRPKAGRRHCDSPARGAAGIRSYAILCYGAVMIHAAIRSVLLAGVALLALPAAAAPLPGPVPATLVRVVDGDTIRIEALVWIDLRVEVLVRIRGIDAPELNASCAEERALAVAATEALAQIAADGPFRLIEIDDDKYFGRVVADVVTASGLSVGEWMLGTGLVRPYDGGARLPWCPQLIGAL